MKAGLVYADSLIFEGDRFSGRWLDLGNPPDLHETTIASNKTDKLEIIMERVTQEKITLSIDIVFDKMVPGVGLFNHRILDHFGQPYFDANIVFQLVGDEGPMVDMEIRSEYLTGLRRSLDEEKPSGLREMQDEFKKRIEKFYSEL